MVLEMPTPGREGLRRKGDLLEGNKMI